MITAAGTVLIGALLGGASALAIFLGVGFGYDAMYATVAWIRRRRRRRTGLQAVKSAGQYRRNAERSERRWNSR